MSGHETLAERKIIKNLKRQIDLRKGPVEKIIELAILCIDPCHDYEKAIDLLENVLKKEPENEKAKILMAYSCIHYLMSDSDLKYAEKLLNEVISKGNREKGSAFMLLAEVLDDLGELTLSQEIEYLKLSVNCEPKWVLNHYLLGCAYHKANQLLDAINHIKQAIANAIPPNPNWSLAENYYEMFITGRNSAIDDLMRSKLENILDQFDKG